MKKIALLLISTLMISTTFTVWAKATIQPYILGSEKATDFTAELSATRSALTNAGFTIAGEYQPYSTVAIVAITNDTLKAHAGKSEFGGYGAVLRVAVTQVRGKVQVAYNNPKWLNAIYRMKGNLNGVQSQLKTALGAVKEFGSNTEFSDGDLRDYQYMMMMPYFDDAIELASYGSHAEAIKVVSSNLAKGKSGSSQVFKVKVTGKEETVFGVAITKGDGADKSLMKIVDAGKLKHSAHLPYEILVSGKNVYMLHGKFRIAQSFPDLTMGTFMEISGAPGDIEDALEAVATK